MVASRGAGGRESCNLAIVESISVGGQAVVRLVRAGDTYLVIGVTKERVTLLGEVDKEQIVEQKAPDLTGLNTPFSKVLSRFMGSKEDGKDE
jgi:flagellar biogenesis protein FliO